jgi:hypothetical protein
MRNLILFLIFNFTIFNATAQNLVPNPSFEFHTPFSSNMMYMNNGNLNTCTPWFRTPEIPGVGGGASSDYINTTMPLDIQPGDEYEIQSPHSGMGMAKFISCSYSAIHYSSESIQIRLNEGMIQGETYQVSFYVKKVDNYNVGGCIYGSDELGIYFHTDTVYSCTSINDHENDTFLRLYEPGVNSWGNPISVFVEYLQTPDVALDTLINDEVNWYLVTDTVYADKPYEFMTFARFNLFEDIQWEIDTTCVYSSASSVMLVDDVSVHLVNEEHIEANAGQDTTICIGALAQIGTTEHEDYMYWWTPDEEMETSIYGGVNPGMPWVSPTETTTYTLTQKDFSFVETTDEVTITVEECIGLEEILAETIKVYPNPASSLVEVISKYPIDSWRLNNALGKEIKCSDLKVKNIFNLNVSSLESGIYYLELNINNQRIIKNLLVK